MKLFKVKFGGHGKVTPPADKQEEQHEDNDKATEARSVAEPQASTARRHATE